jgi:hypothetical protein
MFEIGDKVQTHTDDSLNEKAGVVVAVYPTSVDVVLDEDEVKVPLYFLHTELRKVDE